MKIMLGDYELVHSGVVIQIKDNPIKVTLTDEVEGDFNFIFTFSKDSEMKGVGAVLSEATDKLTLFVDLRNFDAVNGGNTNLIEVGTLRHIPLFLNYRVNDLANVGKMLTFNFYLKEVQDGTK